MSSVIDICNMALAHIGERSDIVSLTEASIEAQRCNQFYPGARRTMLAVHDWTFALKRLLATDLSSANDVPEGWEFAYGLPNDVIKIIGVYDPADWRDENMSPVAHEIGSDSTGPRVLYSNVEDAIVRWKFDQTDTSVYPPLFVEGLQHLLAARLAGPFIKGMEGMKVAQAHMGMAMDYARKAAAEDANQSRSNVRDDMRHNAPWIENRTTYLARLRDSDIDRG